MSSPGLAVAELDLFTFSLFFNSSLRSVLPDLLGSPRADSFSLFLALAKGEGASEEVWISGASLCLEGIQVSSQSRQGEGEK